MNDSETSSLSCHVLNTTHGLPACGIEVAVTPYSPSPFFSPTASSQEASFPQLAPLQKGVTDQDGRFRFDDLHLKQGRYTLTFYTEPYCIAQFDDCFFPVVEVHFIVNEQRHYHVPLLLSPYSYSTYRGS